MKIEIYDTTLRDGAQGEGINFSVADKLRIAEKLDAFGVAFIEGGWPGSNPRDIEFFAEAKRRKFHNAQLAAFGSTRRKNIAAERDEQVNLLVQAKTPVVTIYGKSWLLHVTEVLRTTPAENLAMIQDTIRFLKESGRYVIYDAEHAFDGFKEDPDYAIATWKAAEQGGADSVALCDTNGGCVPSEIYAITTRAKAALGLPIGIHTHNDAGMAIANAMAALEAGATQVQGTFNGYGERTGNCNLTTIIPVVSIKLQKPCIPDRSLPELKALSQFVDEIANLRHDPRQPWVGESAFAHKGGTHVNAMAKIARSYEHVAPEAVGNHRRILVSDLSGRSNILLKAEALGFHLKAESMQLRGILEEIKRLEHAGCEFEAAEASLALRIGQYLDQRPWSFDIESYHVSIRRSQGCSICEASIKVNAAAKVNLTVGEGDGPVNALDEALRLALTPVYPELAQVRLADYKVRILNAGSGAKTRVLITSTDGHDEWCTIGVHENVVEASLDALAEGLEFWLRFKRSPAQAPG